MLPDRWITDWEPDPRFPLHTRANAGEVLPDPVSPLGWTLVWEAGCLPGWRDSMILTGNFEPHEVTPHTPVGMYGGYLYISGTASRLFGVRAPGLTPEMVDLVYFGEHPDVPPYVPEPWHESAVATEKLGAWMGSVLTAEDLPELRAERAEAAEVRAGRGDLTTLTDEALVARARSLTPLMQRLFCRHLTITAASSVGPGVLQGVAAALGDPSIALRLVSSIGDVDSAAASQALWDLSRQVRASAAASAVFDDAVRARSGFDGVLAALAATGDAGAEVFVRAFDRFLVDFGSRGPNEWDLRSEVWETRPALALALIDRMRHQGDDEAPSVRAAVRAADREALTDRVTAALAGDADALAQFQLGLRSAHVHLAGRERTKTTIIRVLHEQRMAVRELGERHGYSLAGITMLLDDELDAFVADPASFRARLAAREQQYLELFDIEPPFIVNGGAPPLTAWRRRTAGDAVAAVVGEVLTGVSGCPGVATGRARVILDPADPTALEPGDVLVAPFTDPAWTPLFVPAAAVVVDVGAQVSHAVIVSRELGIPCAVSVKDATRRIPDGALVRVDGDAGTVTVLEAP